MRRHRAPIGAVFVSALVAPALLAGCGADPLAVAAAGRPQPPGGEPSGGEVAPLPGASEHPAHDAVAPLDERTRPDILVRDTEAIAARELRQLRDTAGVDRAAVVGLSSAVIAEESVTVAAVDPSTYRAFAPEGTAGADAVWQRIAAGEVVVAHPVADRLELPLGESVAVNGTRLRVGAFASTIPGVDAVVDRTTGDRLGITRDSGVVVAAAGEVTEVASRIDRVLGGQARVDRLTADRETGGGRRAFLTGDEAAREFGTFRYRWKADGALWIEPEFVRENIRTERVPLLGQVRCHRLMLPQLRGALQEVVDRGLASRIHPEQYGGCFVPKGIEGSPGAISLHTWGIAIDLNVPGNLRGTEGEIDRRVVAIFKRWGFAWGGDWSWTDPMHFEMAGVLTTSTR